MSATFATTRPLAALRPAAITLGLATAALIALFWPESVAAVRVWSESTAYGHCYLVVPIVAYLIWDRRDSLHGLTPAPRAAFALLALPVAAGWLAADRLGIMEGRQLMAIALLQVLFISVLGRRLYIALSGPLLYLFFLVPFGLFLTPALQTFTAGFIDVGLNALGIPHYINDMTIEIAAGTFFVAEACAGLRFLIASVAFGVFFALLNYRSTGRRLGFIAASIIIPIIANGFRALGIVLLGNILGSAQAAAADHLVYGWFFFSFVTLLLVLSGLPFRQAPAPAPGPGLASDGPLPPRGARSAMASGLGAALPVLLVGMLAPALALALDRNVAPARIAERPVFVAPSGCRIEAGPTPAAAASDRITDTLVCADRNWTITAQAVPGRSTGAALVQARSALTRSAFAGPVDDEETTAGVVRTAPRWRTLVAHNPGLVLATAAWVDGRPASGGLGQRLQQARDSLLGASHDAMVMALAYRPGGALSETAAAVAMSDLEAFLSAQPDLDHTVAAATAR